VLQQVAVVSLRPCSYRIFLEYKFGDILLSFVWLFQEIAGGVVCEQHERRRLTI
jgi:hypothetical protein